MYLYVQCSYICIVNGGFDFTFDNGKICRQNGVPLSLQGHLQKGLTCTKQPVYEKREFHSQQANLTLKSCIFWKLNNF